VSRLRVFFSRLLGWLAAREHASDRIAVVKLKRPPAARRPAMWRCPTCSRQFANRNQSHACGTHNLESHFAGKLPVIREIFDHFVTTLRQNGPVIVLPERTRIAFQVRMSFAQLTPKRNWVDGHLVLARRVESPMFTRVESFSPRNHLHAFRLVTPADVTPALGKLMAEAYLVGDQQHLRPKLRKG
jgi:hypothetical protein